ncbi:MAG TPA: hypothetical protein VKD24_07785 [Candidatus Angelobacter sp.]|nr:hypothetical protein [Candidatus Angelobacter sp.]
MDNSFDPELRLSGNRDVTWITVSEDIHEREKNLMSARAKMETTAKIPPEINTKLRALAHDLSNSIETIMQASYLLAQMQLEEDAKKWADLVDKAGQDCARINREIRDILRASA